MVINSVDKIKIIKVLNSYGIDDIYYDDLTSAVGKKYKEKDYLEFFIEYLEESLKKDKVQTKLLAKMCKFIMQIIEYLISKNIVIEGILVKKLYGLKEIIDEPLINEEMLEILNDIEAFLKEKCLINGEIIDEINSEEQNERVDNPDIEELKASLKTSEKTVLKKDGKINMLRNNIKNKDKEIKKLDEEIKNFQKEIEFLNLKINEAKEELAKSDITINELKDKYEKLIQIKNEAYKNLKQLYDELKSEYEKLSEELQTTKSKLCVINTKYDNLQKNNKKLLNLKKIEETILIALCKQPCTLEDLIKILKGRRIDFTMEEIYQVIRKLKQKVNIETSSISLKSPYYSLKPPAIKQNEVFDFLLDTNSDYIDILLTADYHIYDIENFENKFLPEYQKLLEYCDVNNIKFIINLGDFYDFGKVGYDYSLNRFKEMESIVEHTINNLPYLNGMHQAILGGNHDESNMYLGIDYLKQLIDSREDFISLGYKYSILNLNVEEKNLTKILLGHPKSHLDRNKLEEKIHKICSRTSTGLNSYYFCFLGHSHENFIDINKRICALPSYSMDKNHNGAIHLRIYYNGENIECMSLKSLILEKKLKPVSELMYKK